jgi:hypothetical protein
MTTTILTTMKQAIEIIKSAITSYSGQTGPGRFKAMMWDTGFGLKPALVYCCAISDGDNDSQPGPEWQSVLDPWKRWGGDQMLAAIQDAGLAFCDGLVELNDGVYYDAATFN